MRCLPMALSLMMLFGATTVYGKEHKISACKSAATKEIKLGLKFISSQLKSILGKSSLSKKKQKKVEKKWAKIKVKCIDKKRVCKKPKGKDAVTRAMGRAHGILSKTVGICYDAHIRWQEHHNTVAFCELVDTLFHETGHALNIGTGTAGHKVGDRIHKMGNAAGKHCRSLGKDRKLAAK